MADKKPQDKKPGTRFSAATRMLGSELRATLQAPPAEEPWQKKLPKGKGGKKKR